MKQLRRENLFQVRDKDQKSAYVSVYCKKPGHKSSECELVSGIRERRPILSKNQLRFNCTSPKHRTYDCRSNKGCVNCKGKYHTSICEKTPNVLLTSS